MQIPSTSIAASIAGLAAKPSQGKDTHETAASALSQPVVEQSGESNPDRDAQGQGDGIPARRDRLVAKKKEEHPTDAPPNEHDQNLSGSPALPGEPPSQLDLLG
jgi:hypothetical protein